ncbi:hypothetical protein TWF281_006030 [Arthrobotrys megalospora]
MANWTLSLAAASTLLALAAEGKPHALHHHLKRATATPSYTLVYSNLHAVPDFDDCIDYTIIEGAGNYSTIAAQCAKTADVPTTGAKFFAVYKTIGQKRTNEWWCGWWEVAVSSMGDVTEEWQEDGDEIITAYGYNFTSGSIKGSTATSSSVKGSSTLSSTLVKGSISASGSSKGSAVSSTSIVSTTTAPATSSRPGSTPSTSSASSTPSTPPTSVIKPSSTTAQNTTLKTASTSLAGKDVSSTSASTPSSSSGKTSSTSTSSTGNVSSSSSTSSFVKTSSSTSTSSSSTGMASSSTATSTAKKASPSSATSSTRKVSSTATTSKVGPSSSSQATTRSSTQQVPTGSTTVTYVATATGVAGFSFVTGAIDAVPSQNIINYWISDTDFNTPNPQVSCSNHCSTDSNCQSFAVWAQKTCYNCATYSVATTTSILQTSTMTTLDNGTISSAIIFNKGKDIDLTFKYSFENPTCGMKGYLWYENAFPDGSLDDIDDVATCANYCKSQSGCLNYQWQPSTQRCQTWNKDIFSAGYLTYDPTSTTFWYDSKCDVSKALSPTFRNTRLTADQKAKYCGVKGNYNTAASVNTYKVNNVATADECGKWCHVYPVFNSYRWSTKDGSCICQAPSIGMAVVANASSTDVHYSMDCYSKMSYLYTDMTVL